MYHPLDVFHGVPRSLSESSISNAISPPEADSSVWLTSGRETAGRLRLGFAGTRGTLGLETVVVLIVVLVFPFAIPLGRGAVARTVGFVGFAGFDDFLG